MRASVRFPSQEEVDGRLKRGEWQIHKFPKGFLLTEIVQHQEERVLLIHVLRGDDFDEWMGEAWERMKSFGRGHGCKAVEVLVRLGLTKKLKPLGFKHTRSELRADI